MAAGHDEVRAACDGAAIVDVGQHQLGARSAQPVQRLAYGLVVVMKIHDARVSAAVEAVVASSARWISWRIASARDGILRCERRQSSIRTKIGPSSSSRTEPPSSLCMQHL